MSRRSFDVFTFENAKIVGQVSMMIMRTDIPEPWKCVGGHDPAVVVHDLPRYSCKSIQKVQKVLFSVLTVAFILHALDS